MKRVGAFCWGAVIGVLGGLIGLGGAEFRLPVLISFYRYRASQAIVINLIVSLVTVVFSFIFRTGVINLDKVVAQYGIVIDILCGSLIGSYLGVRLATRINEHTLTRLVAVFLIALSFVLISHDFIFHAQRLFLPAPLDLIVGAIMGVVIGLFSSMLGVAGGELIIPTIILLFGIDIKLAGTLSLAISIPTIIMGLIKYGQRGRLSGIGTEAWFIFFMALGSIVGALIGSYLLRFAPSSILQIMLGIILLISAFKLLRKERELE